MIPKNSNLAKENCSPTSSNCVVWQGPDIACINLCTGDSVSDVVYKLAEEICTLKDNIGITDVDLTCLVTVCQNTAEPSKSLSNVLQFLIDKVCCIGEKVDDLPPPVDPYIEPELNFPVCNAFSGFPSDIKLSDYVVILAQKICAMYDDISANSADIAAHLIRLNTIDATLLTKMDKINLTSCLSLTTIPLQTLLVNLENAFCSTNAALGTPSSLTAVIGAQCSTLNGSTKSLTDSTQTMASLFPSWVASPGTVAESLNNLWLTVCDIRSAVKLIQDTCCKVSCEDIIIDFTSKWDTSDTLLLFFYPKSTLGATFYDCNQFSGNALTLTDGNGAEAPVSILFRNSGFPTNTSGALDDPDFQLNGYPIEGLDNTSLDVTTGLTLSGNICFTDGSTQCIKCINITIPPYVNTDCCKLTGQFGPVTITYKYCYPVVEQ